MTILEIQATGLITLLIALTFLAWPYIVAEGPGPSGPRPIKGRRVYPKRWEAAQVAAWEANRAR